MAVRRETGRADDSNTSPDWTTTLYVCVAVIPVIFLCCALWWHIRKTRRAPKNKQLDVEMNKLGKDWWKTDYLQSSSEVNLDRQTRRDRVYENLSRSQRPGLFGSSNAQSKTSLDPQVPPPVAVSCTKREPPAPMSPDPKPRQTHEGYRRPTAIDDAASSVYSQDTRGTPSKTTAVTPVLAPLTDPMTLEINRILNLNLEPGSDKTPRKLDAIPEEGIRESRRGSDHDAAHRRRHHSRHRSGHKSEHRSKHRHHQSHEERERKHHRSERSKDPDRAREKHRSRKEKHHGERERERDRDRDRDRGDRGAKERTRKPSYR